MTKGYIVKFAQSCLTVCDSVDYTVRGILQARILDWVAFPFSREGVHAAAAAAKSLQLCLTLCNPRDHTVHGILQARILDWVAFPFSRGSSQPKDQTQVSRIVGGLFTR